MPYEVYPLLDFHVPTGTTGDSFDRYKLRIEEMRQSLNIIHQCINKIVEGPTLTQNQKITFPTRSEIKNSMEALINHFKIYGEGYKVPKTFTYSAVESPKGEFGVSIASNNTTKPLRCKFKTPGFSHLQSMKFMAPNHYLADISAIIGTQDIVFGEIDR